MFGEKHLVKILK